MTPLRFCGLLSRSEQFDRFEATFTWNVGTCQDVDSERIIDYPSDLSKLLEEDSRQQWFMHDLVFFTFRDTRRGVEE